jgi:uncharacterized protein YceK
MSVLLVLLILALSGCATKEVSSSAGIDAQNAIQNAKTYSEKIEAEARYLQGH